MYRGQHDHVRSVKDSMPNPDHYCKTFKSPITGYRHLTHLSCRVSQHCPTGLSTHQGPGGGAHRASPAQSAPAETSLNVQWRT